MIFSIIVRKKYLYGAFKIIFSPETFSTSVGHTGDNLERRFRRHLGGRGLRDKYIPVKWIKMNQRLKPPWTNYRSVVHAKKEKRKAQVKSQISNLNADKELLILISRDYKNKVDLAKSLYEDKYVDDIPKNPKRFFNYARNCTRASSTIDTLVYEGKTVTDNVEKANIFNNLLHQ